MSIANRSIQSNANEFFLDFNLVPENQDFLNPNIEVVHDAEIINSAKKAINSFDNYLFEQISKKRSIEAISEDSETIDGTKKGINLFNDHIFEQTSKKPHLETICEAEAEPIQTFNWIQLQKIENIPLKMGIINAINNRFYELHAPMNRKRTIGTKNLYKLYPENLQVDIVNNSLKEVRHASDWSNDFDENFKNYFPENTLTSLKTIRVAKIVKSTFDIYVLGKSFKTIMGSEIDRLSSLSNLIEEMTFEKEPVRIKPKQYFERIKKILEEDHFQLLCVSEKNRTLENKIEPLKADEGIDGIELGKMHNLPVKLHVIRNIAKSYQDCYEDKRNRPNIGTYELYQFIPENLNIKLKKGIPRFKSIREYNPWDVQMLKIFKKYFPPQSLDKQNKIVTQTTFWVSFDMYILGSIFKKILGNEQNLVPHLASVINELQYYPLEKVPKPKQFFERFEYVIKKYI